MAWTTPEPATSYVDFGMSAALGRTTPRGEALTTDHRVLVVGLPASCDCFLQARSETARGVVVTSELVPFPTPAPDEGTTTVTTGLDLDGSLEVPIAFTVVAAAPGVVIVDPDGEIIWWRTFQEGFGGMQVRFSDDGLHLMYDHTDGEWTDPMTSTIVRTRLDGADGSVTPIPYGHHDFLVQESGNYLYLAADTRELDYEGDGVLDLVVGDALRETTPGGTVVAEHWNSWNSLPVTHARVGPFYPGALDWTHANGIYQTDDAWYLSSHALSTIFKIDRETGGIDWEIGGDTSDFLFEDTRPFVQQHSPRWIDGHLYVFNNSDGSGRPPSSYPVEYEVDEGTGLIHEVRSYDRNGDTYSYILGNVDVLPDGGWLIGWGSASMIEELGPDGRIRRALQTELGHTVGNVHATPELGGPVPE